MPTGDRHVDTSTATADGSDFEGGIGNWSTGDQASAAAASTDRAHRGTYSVKVTRSAVSPGSYLVVSGSDFPVTASAVWFFEYWLYTSAAAGVFRTDVDWYQADGSTYISSFAGTNVSATPNQWTKAGPFTATSPALAGFARPALVSVSGMAAGTTVYLDDVFFGRRIWRSCLVMPQSVTRASIR
ncbi:hypothetical protein [Streptomyces sp. NPDC052496]|uniref:hypothetical protein n=1 Tax=Streptomyces sp. NPDC052496 TaxID=3154951 RepID=UPI00343F3C5E